MTSIHRISLNSHWQIISGLSSKEIVDKKNQAFIHLPLLLSELGKDFWGAKITSTTTITNSISRNFGRPSRILPSTKIWLNFIGWVHLESITLNSLGIFSSETCFDQNPNYQISESNTRIQIVQHLLPRNQLICQLKYPMDYSLNKTFSGTALLEEDQEKMKIGKVYLEIEQFS